MRGLVAALGLSMAVATVAHAQGRAGLERGLDAYANADFPAAVAELDRAAEAGGLAPEELARLYETRALAEHALDQESRVDADLRRLAAIDPDHRFGPGAPPEIVGRFGALRRRSVPSPGETARLTPPAPSYAADPADEDAAPAWPWIAGAAGVAVAAVIVVLWATASPSGDTPVDGPTFP